MTIQKLYESIAIALVIEQGYTLPDAAQSFGIRANLLYA